MTEKTFRKWANEQPKRFVDDHGVEDEAWIGPPPLLTYIFTITAEYLRG